MIPPTNILALFFVIGSSYAVFYTRTTETEYPRIGRRAFYTTGNGYPRIGRRANPDFLSADELSESPEALSDLGGALDKRGLYTSGGGYPRVGRSGADTSRVLQSMRQSLLKKMAALAREEEEEDGEEVGEDGMDLADSSRGKEEDQKLDFSKGIMFMAFDQNGDGQLSKEEFSHGMDRYREGKPFVLT